MICSLEDSLFGAFGPLTPSRHHRRLQRIADRIGLRDGELLFEELYGAELFEADSLIEPYTFTFKGDPLLVDAVFQAVGFATRLGVAVPSAELPLVFRSLIENLLQTGKSRHPPASRTATAAPGSTSRRPKSRSSWRPRAGSAGTGNGTPP